MRLRVVAFLFPSWLVLAGSGCDGSRHAFGSDDAGAKPDFTLAFDYDGFSVPDLAMGSNACGDNVIGCMDLTLGPAGGHPFPLAGDPNQASDGVGPDKNGYLTLDQSHGQYDYLWIANNGDWQRGTISKLSSKAVREVARYLSVTCSSLPTGNKRTCDGTNGCCSKDDYPRWNARRTFQVEPKHLAVQLMANNPSRTAVDFNGDLFVANRAFGGQSSVTRIANDLSNCVDRNQNGQIDTSSDGNGNGVIETDCNNNGIIDDLDDVAVKPCLNGARQEFFGLDDECILWTTNTNVTNQWGRPLALGPGAADASASDAWAGTYQDGKFFRIDGVSGLTKDQWQLPGECHPYGAAMDADGYLWTPSLDGGPLCYLNTRRNTDVGRARDATYGALHGYGVSMDRDQNVWIGGLGTPDVFRYTPDRSNGFQNLANGWWVKINHAGNAITGPNQSFGVAADSRTVGQYFVWLAVGNGYIVRLPGSDLDRMVRPKMDNMLDGTNYPAVQVAGQDLRGVGVDRDQNLWGISNLNSVVTHVAVDATGRMSVPNINGKPIGNNKCPSGDVCYLSKDRGQDTNPYTYSDFTGFGLRNFTRPKGTYSYIFNSCDPALYKGTEWYAILYDADVPASTTLQVRARTGKNPTPDTTWGPWTPLYSTSPADLRAGMPPSLMPFDVDDYFLQVEFVFSTSSRSLSPVLREFQVGYRCRVIG